MTLTLYGIPNCDSVKRARAWLATRGIDYRFHDYKKLGAEAEKLAGWADSVGWEALLNRSGTTFRGLSEHDRTDINRSRALALMAAHPSLIRRPVVEHRGGILVGFTPDAYARVLD